MRLSVTLHSLSRICFVSSLTIPGRSLPTAVITRKFGMWVVVSIEFILTKNYHTPVLRGGKRACHLIGSEVPWALTDQPFGRAGLGAPRGRISPRKEY